MRNGNAQIRAYRAICATKKGPELLLTTCDARQAHRRSDVNHAHSLTCILVPLAFVRVTLQATKRQGVNGLLAGADF